MTVDNVVTSREAVDYHSLYLPLISQALDSRSVGLSLTSFGRLVLALSVFFATLKSDVADLSNIDARAEEIPARCLRLDPATDVIGEWQATEGIGTTRVDDNVTSSIKFVALEPTPVIGPVLSCERRESDIADLIGTIKSNGFKIFLVAMGDQLRDTPLKIIEPDPQVLRTLSFRQPRLVLFFCKLIDKDVFVGKRIADFAHINERIR
ncbi:hypothetical protein DPSP01_013140 [Paraphaeosphaeria sporulosa]